MAASEQWPDLVAHGFSVLSGIPEQPMADAETKLGSVNRAKGALEMGLKKLEKELEFGIRAENGAERIFRTSSFFSQKNRVQKKNEGEKNKLPNPKSPTTNPKQRTTSNEQLTTNLLGVGMEGGVFLNENDELWSTVWVTVIDTQGNIFSANGARFKVPAKIADPILAGGEMGPIVGEFFKDPELKQKQGAIGVITQGFVDRTEEYTGIAKLALGLWYGKGWEEKIAS